MKKYVVVNKKADFGELAKSLGIDPVIARIIRNRDIETLEEMEIYLNGSLKDIHSPWLLPDMEKAVNIIKEKIEQKKKIRIIGDYDIDGIQSTYILYDALLNIGADISYAIPDRIVDGYGINESLIQKAYDAGVDTILTCDNGISALNQITYAKELGMTVVVTDHHDVPYDIMEDGTKKQKLVSADAVVNPKRDAEIKYPYEEICGAVVAWKFILALYEKLGMDEKAGLKYLENAAFATVGDVMSLRDENRIIIKSGLNAMRHTKCPGLSSLMNHKNIKPEDLNAHHLGFVLGPCINASGRIDTAARSLELFTEKDENKARVIAELLADINDTRKDMTKEGETAAFAEVDSGRYESDNVLVIYMPELHESLAGIVAGRIRERYYKPTLVLTKTQEGSVKGSGRSIEAYNMYEELCKVDDLLTKYGGHPLAAGISLEEENIDELRRRLNENSPLTEEDLQEKIQIDVVMPLAYVSPSFIRQLELLEPLGKGNTKPVFADRDIQIHDMRVNGANRNVLKLTLGDKYGNRFTGVYFGNADEKKVELSNLDKVSIIYYPKFDTYRGNDSIQFVINDFI